MISRPTAACSSLSEQRAQRISPTRRVRVLVPLLKYRTEPSDNLWGKVAQTGLRGKGSRVPIIAGATSGYLSFFYADYHRTSVHHRYQSETLSHSRRYHVYRRNESSSKKPICVTLTGAIFNSSCGNTESPKQGGKGPYGWTLADTPRLAQYLLFFRAVKIGRVKIILARDILHVLNCEISKANWQIPIILHKIEKN